MNRRDFFSLLSGLPFVGTIFGKGGDIYTQEEKGPNDGGVWVYYGPNDIKWRPNDCRQEFWWTPVEERLPECNWKIDGGVQSVPMLVRMDDRSGIAVLQRFDDGEQMWASTPDGSGYCWRMAVTHWHDPWQVIRIRIPMEPS